MILYFWPSTLWPPARWNTGSYGNIQLKISKLVIRLGILLETTYTLIEYYHINETAMKSSYIVSTGRSLPWSFSNPSRDNSSGWICYRSFRFHFHLKCVTVIIWTGFCRVNFSIVLHPRLTPSFIVVVFRCKGPVILFLESVYLSFLSIP